MAGLISQPAFQDAYKQPIIYPNTTFSVRVTARIPASIALGTLVITLSSSGDHNYGAFALSFSAMSSVDGDLHRNASDGGVHHCPRRTWCSISQQRALGIDADIEIDRIEVFPTEIPILGTTVFGSYSGLPEQVDAVSGRASSSPRTSSPSMAVVVMYDTFYGLKGQGPNASMYSWQASPTLSRRSGMNRKWRRGREPAVPWRSTSGNSGS